MFWKSCTIEEDTLYFARIGPLKLWIRKIQKDWYLATLREAEENGFEEIHQYSGLLPEDLYWNRWVLSSNANKIHFLPVMPDKSIVIRPEIPIRIPTGNSGKFFVNIPVWIKIEVGEKKLIKLTELPINQLSKSWFGDSSSGELCYSKKSFVRRELNELKDNPCSAVCTVKIKNNSKTELNFERFCINVENLSVFSNSKNLCTNHVDVFFRGEEQESQILISRTHSGSMQNYSLISPSRKKIDNNIIKLSYQFIKSVTRM